MILRASSRNVTTIKNRPMAGRYLQGESASAMMRPSQQFAKQAKHLHTVLCDGASGYRCRLTYGFRGPLRESRMSSILLVCALMASRGLGSLPSILGPPKGVWLLSW